LSLGKKLMHRWWGKGRKEYILGGGDVLHRKIQKNRKNQKGGSRRGDNYSWKKKGKKKGNRQVISRQEKGGEKGMDNSSS